MKKTELQASLKANSTELSTIGSIEVSGKTVTYPAHKEQLVKRAIKESISRELILSGKFELDMYEQSLIKWSSEFGKIKVSSVSDCFKLKTPSLATLKKYKGELKALATVCKMIEEVYEFFNVTNTLNDLQLQMTASLLLEEYYFLTIADIR